ncbi:LysR substrate-binding domain-containing protein [Pandoraea sputorum]|uniref:LysR substrate-binding domain-containing protein n=1 Tax=Pandoraea sputorum TaxID=93222 RepID=UPI001E4CA303|nr:LysR substrate-binding domain-containing protein [Pandoraea sputorum]MCE4058723.1 LysR substrate-binding domain-containing protein [Pandoraea sputorum]
MSTNHTRLPSLNMIAAFEASARHLSFTRASEELHLSQAAISRQVQSLETRLGVDLFVRRHKEISLTKAGVLFQEAIAEGLAGIRNAISHIQGLNDTSVTVSASLAMASFWLMPAILEFREEHPDILIRVLASEEASTSVPTGADLAIRYGSGTQRTQQSFKLFDEIVFPICTPSFLRGRDVLELEDLADEPLVELDSRLTAYGRWGPWLQAAGLETLPAHFAFHMTTSDLVFRAVYAGKGIGLGWSYGSLRDIKDGTLVKPMRMYLRTGFAEYIVTPANEVPRESTSLFIEWLRNYAARQREEIQGILAGDAELKPA